MSYIKTYKDISTDALQGLPNPAVGYEQKIEAPEFTFLGVKNQPDFGKLTLRFYGGDITIELKSLKEYLLQFRDIVVSYERLAKVVFDQINEVYSPQRLILELELTPRGGISSKLKYDSEWSK